MIVEYGKYKEFSEKQIKEILKKEGFTNIYTWSDYPGSHYPDHTHNFYSAHIVIEGEIKIIANGKEYVFTKGDRFDVLKNEVHAAKIGEKGCTYIIGEKY
ncbi:MAG: AraC family ligand binding domain-containing protein [Candidatus Calescibacterium sp.]|nr:AraC family ligand binding domain-containing protein [Candidatus Calescibacterium sp.]